MWSGSGRTGLRPMESALNKASCRQNLRVQMQGMDLEIMQDQVRDLRRKRCGNEETMQAETQNRCRAGEYAGS